jgi:hypothetical protein
MGLVPLTGGKKKNWLEQRERTDLDTGKKNGDGAKQRS